MTQSAMLEWAWGVDCDTKAAHVASFNAYTGEFFTTSWGWKHDVSMLPVERLRLCREVVKAGASVRCGFYPPMVIALELPTGRFPKPPLMMHAGVIAEGLAAGAGLTPWFLAVSEWRKGIGLKGNAKKAEVVAWAEALGWQGESVDQAEALGVAVAAANFWNSRTEVAA